MSSFSNAIAGAFDTLKGVAGVTVTYTRLVDDVEQSVALTAVPGRSFDTQLTNDGATVRARVKDFILKTSELVLNGQAVTPEKYDEIAETIGDSVYTWETLPLNGEKCFHYSDTQQYSVRVHCKLKSVDHA